MSESLSLFPEVHRYASFSPDRTYRYDLRRIWGPDGGKVMFVGLNPSTADEREDDPTIRRCIRFARDWGYGGLVMTNLFAFRATDPSVMKRASGPIGPENNDALASWAEKCELVVAAWGVHGEHLGRDSEVKRLIEPYGVLKLTLGGHPGHPLYLPIKSRPFDPVTLEPIPVPADRTVAA